MRWVGGLGDYVRTQGVVAPVVYESELLVGTWGEVGGEVGVCVLEEGEEGGGEGQGCG